MDDIFDKIQRREGLDETEYYNYKEINWVKANCKMQDYHLTAFEKYKSYIKQQKHY